MLKLCKPVLQAQLLAMAVLNSKLEGGRACTARLSLESCDRCLIPIGSGCADCVEYLTVKSLSAVKQLRCVNSSATGHATASSYPIDRHVSFTS
jgi:hypothetical protein